MRHARPAIMTATVLLLAACGGGGDDDSSAAAPVARTAATDTTTTTAAATASSGGGETTLNLTGAHSFSYDGPGGSCSTVWKDDYGEEAAEHLDDMTAYGFSPADKSFRVTVFDYDNDGDIDQIILNHNAGVSYLAGERASTGATGQTDLKGVTFDVELAPQFGGDAVHAAGSISCS